MKDSRTTEQKISDLEAAIAKAVDHWNDIHDNGCSDPFWSDGVNMNLVRNHVIYYLKQISELTRQPMQMSMFSDVEVTIADSVMSDPRIPPMVANDFMACERKCFYVKEGVTA